MALPSLVELEDFETWASRPVSNGPRATAILSAASTLVRTRSGRMWVDAAGDPETDVTETQLDAARSVVMTVSERVYFNPNGNTQESTGPFQRSIAAWASLGLALSEDELQMIGTTVTGIPGLSSVRVIAPAAARGTRYTTEWWEDDPDSEIGEGDTGS